MRILHDTIQNPKYFPFYRRFRVDPTRYHPRQNLVGKCLLAKLLHVSLAQVINGRLFVYGQFGKPYLRSRAFAFNLTNSKAQVILVADRHNIAVDTEKIRPIDYHRIHRAFTPLELTYLAQTPPADLDRTTLRMWTVKEGVLKLIGTGLNGGVRTVHVQLPKMRLACRKNRWYRLMPYNVTPAYVGVIVKEFRNG